VTVELGARGRVWLCSREGRQHRRPYRQAVAARDGGSGRRLQGLGEGMMRTQAAPA
jgi:hypothetical protein